MAGGEYQSARCRRRLKHRDHHDGGEIDYTGTGSTDLARFGSATLNVNGGAFKLDGSLRVGVFEINGQGTINLSSGSIRSPLTCSSIRGASNGGALTRLPFGEAYQTGGTMQVVALPMLASPRRREAMLCTNLPAVRSELERSTWRNRQATFRVTNPAAEITLQTNMTVTNNAHIEAAEGTTIRFASPTGTLVGDPTSPYFAQNIYFENGMDIADVANVAGLENTTLVFAGGALVGSNVGLFEVAANDLGATPAGFVNNFMLGGLSIGDSLNVGNLKLTDKLLNGAANSTPQAVYVDISTSPRAARSTSVDSTCTTARLYTLLPFHCHSTSPPVYSPSLQNPLAPDKATFRWQ